MDDLDNFQKCVARALYDNISESPDELAFRRGDILTVLEQNTSGLEGWWLCSLRGRQGICPGNRLRLLAGVYDSPSKYDNNKVIKNEVPISYDIPKYREIKYDVPGQPVAVNGNFRGNLSFAKHSDRPGSGSSSSNSNATDDSCCDKYDIPKRPVRLRKLSEGGCYDVPRSSAAGSASSPANSICSLGGTESACSSNRSSSVVPDYDVPKSKPVPVLPISKGTATCAAYDVPSRNHLKELPLELNSAIETLERLEGEVYAAIGRLLSFACPDWRLKSKLEPVLMDVKLAAVRLRSSLHDLSEFAQGILGNAVQSQDKSLSSKLWPLVRNLSETNKTVQTSVNVLDSFDWSLDYLTDESAKDNRDPLDKLILNARSLTEDVRTVTSFVQGNATLLFKRTAAIPSFRGCNNKNECHYADLEAGAADDDDVNDDGNCRKNGENGGGEEKIKRSSAQFLMDRNDKQVLLFYGAQCSTHTIHLTRSVNAFLACVERNEPPKAFLSRGKFVVLNAYRLLEIGDVLRRNVACSGANAKIAGVCDSLAVALTSCVHKIKTAAAHFPSVCAVQEMAQAVVDVAHFSRDLKMYVITCALTTTNSNGE